MPALSARLVPQVVPKDIVLLEEHLDVDELPSEPRHLLGRADRSVARARPHRLARPVSAWRRPRPASGCWPWTSSGSPSWRSATPQGRELVTVVELLSPSNKRPGPDRDQYLAKRRELLRSPAHLVEIDLLRGGRPVPLADRPECAYSVLVSRVEVRPDAGFWPIGVRAPRPVIPIPLRPPDGEARGDPQEVLHRVDDETGSEHFISAGGPEPALAPDDAARARQFVPLPARGPRRRASLHGEDLAPRPRP